MWDLWQQTYYLFKKVKHKFKNKLKVNWIDQIYQANFSAKARGVAILFRKNVPFIHPSTVTDPEGRFLIVFGSLNPIPPVNVYGPNFDSPLFFQKVFNSIPNLSDNVVIGRDFNCIMDPLLDKQSVKTLQKSNSSICLKTLMESLNFHIRSTETTLSSPQSTKHILKWATSCWIQNWYQ